MIDDLNDQQEPENSREMADEGTGHAGAPENNGDEAGSLSRQLQEANDKFMRLYAEFDNYKRRTIKERAEILQTAGKDVMLALLPVIDDFERAQKAAASVPDLETYKEGIALIHHKFNSILQAKGLKPVESVGKDFNVDLHEAITNIPAPSPELVGKVIDETEKGYTMNGHVIRFAKVVVGE